MERTAIHRVCNCSENELYIKRDDLIPFSFGGNKARKAIGFFNEIDAGDYDCVVTYGSGSSNHCRVVANMACARGMKCYIISPVEASAITFNSKMMEFFGAEITTVPVEKVSTTIEEKLEVLKAEGHKPYFIAGGGHGNVGTQAYFECYSEIREFEKEHNIFFDYIFHATGTGTTQAGLVCGMIANNDSRNIIGISIARNNPRGRDVVTESVKQFLAENNIGVDDNLIDRSVIFNDAYVLDGYGKYNSDIESVVNTVMQNYGIPLDTTYTGKAYFGMIDYLNKNGIKNKNILFIHTGGTPLFFDYLFGIKD